MYPAHRIKIRKFTQREQMTRMQISRCAIALFAALLCTTAPAEKPHSKHSASGLPSSTPEALGFSPEGLEPLHAAMQQLVDQKNLPGIVTILARHGKIAEEKTYGKKDLTTGAPMTQDTIFRIFSMSKPVTGVAMMILYEQGKWSPDDPISKFIPKFAHLKVFKGTDASGNVILEDPDHPPTMGELMTHTAGFTYGIFGNTPVDKIYRDKGILNSQSLEDMIDKLAKTPLLYQPGTRWVYSVSMDIQGYIIEKLSGKSLPDFLQQHIFGPLGMVDTGFFVPQNKRSRFASLYTAGPNGGLVASPGSQNGSVTDYAEPPAMPSGGGGLLSTADDYLRFAQMLLNNGELNGVRILAPATVKLMTSNHLSPSLMTGEFSIGTYAVRRGSGWGFDCAVVNDPLEANEVVGKGTFFWSGAADTWFWVDPTNDLIFIGMTQHIGSRQPHVNAISRPAVYQALTNPKM
jgi:CubicO group peptidase (beta-lactamase class C family)